MPRATGKPTASPCPDDGRATKEMGLRTFFGALRLAHHSEKLRKLGGKAAHEAETAAEHAGSLAEMWEKLADPPALTELLAEALGASAGESAQRAWEAAVAKGQSAPQEFIAAGSEVFTVAAETARAASEAKTHEAHVIRQSSRSLALVATAKETEAAMAALESEIEEVTNEAAEEMALLADMIGLVEKTSEQLAELALRWWAEQGPH